MPATIVLAVVSWFASHLILFTLLGFVVVGILLFGEGESPVNRASAPAPAPLTEPVEDRAPPVERSRDIEKAETAMPAPASAPERTATQPPRLIGGSLPIYDRLPEGGQPVEQRGVEGFRPSMPLPPVDSSPVDDYETGTQVARRAFWNGEFEAAEAAYMALVDAFPNDADVFGELGNLYESMGEKQLALDAYFAAGERLMRNGESGKLKHVIDLLEKKGDPRASELKPR